MPQRRWTYRAVARVLDCSEKTIRRLVKAGKLAAPIVYDGLGVRFLEEDILLYLATANKGRQPQNPGKTTRQDGTGRDK